MQDRAPRDIAALLSTALFGGGEARAFAPLAAGDLPLLVERVASALAKRAKDEPTIAVEPFAAVAGAQYTLLVVVNDDGPFLVDSVMGEVQSRKIDVLLVLHPILTVERDARGRLVQLAEARTAETPGARRESVIVAVLPPSATKVATDLAATLASILAEVRAAVDDWRPMVARLDAAVAALERASPNVPRNLVAEAAAFGRWLREGRFTFLGMREYRLDGAGDLAAIEGSGLGLLKNPAVQVLRRGRDLVATTPEVRRFLVAPEPIIVTKSSVIARVHRRAHMDYIGLKTYRPDGAATGELRIVGLFTSRAYAERPQDIPFLRLKVAEVIKSFGFSADSHDAKALVHIIEAFPRDELFQIGAKQLVAYARAILDLELRPRTRVLARVDRFDRFVSALVFVPRDRFSTATREKIGDALAEAYGGRIVAFQPTFTEGPLVRVHFIVARFEGKTPKVKESDLENRVRAVVRTWTDALETELAEAGQGELFAKYEHAFSAGYSETFPVSRALEDVARIERLGPDRPWAVDFYREPGLPASRVRAAVYRLDRPIPLSDRVPVFENLGFRVIDERSYRVHPAMPEGRREVSLHDMMLESASGADIDIALHGERLEACTLAVADGRTESDAFNALVVASGATWRECALFRAYAAYLRQVRSPFGPRYIAETLVRHAGLARDLIELFYARFDPDWAGTSDAEAPSPRLRGEGWGEGRKLALGMGRGDANAIRDRFLAALANVPSLDEDRILRRLLNLVLATVRTNFFAVPHADDAPSLIAFKFASGDIEGLPSPPPFREIWVASPRVEGVHLRFAPIARGGVRWSDRAQDFRAEVLGLARAQQVKNTVIVPQGAKGGFFPKRRPRDGAREEVQAEGVACYRAFVSALLDLTDNVEDGRVVGPPRVVRHDGDDPYLVVAADKGTASFSDMANAIAMEHGFWLGDAFASGGSAGYDHKKMGITARGAWVCVERHFREMGRDMAEPFTVAGVGDMSGDVFGNGMLLSPAIRLIAAFDHRDIFLDPDPDPEASFAERKRLFDLSRSSWQDYERRLISKGGGIFSRALKSIPFSPQARAALGVDAQALTPADLIRAILSAPVDLVWFGGVGTYVRAATETDDQVGDRANDALRVTAADLRTKVVGEGANLAVTQRGRIEYALKGGRINADFIDNAAGVNASDHEVNIKIALGPAVRSGRLDLAARNKLLAEMTGDVAAACLATNHRQSLALSLAERMSRVELGAYDRLMTTLETRGLMNRAAEALPSSAELTARRTAGVGLTRPELAVLLSYAKLALSHDLLAGATADEPALEPLLPDYFPPALRKRFEKDLTSHKLRREIIATELTNMVVDRAGPPFALGLAENTGRTPAEAAMAYVAADRTFSIDSLWREVDALDGRLPSERQLDLYAALALFLRERAAWFARVGFTTDDFAAALERHYSAASAIRAALPAILPPALAGRLEFRVEEFASIGASADLARRLAEVETIADSPDITLVAEAVGAGDIAAVGRTYFMVGDRLGLNDLKARAVTLAADDPFDRLAINGALASLSASQREIVRRVLSEGALESLSHSLDRLSGRLSEIVGAGALTVSRLTVAAAEAEASSQAPKNAPRGP